MHDGECNLFVLRARPDNTQNDIYEYWEKKTNSKKTREKT